MTFIQYLTSGSHPGRICIFSHKKERIDWIAHCKHDPYPIFDTSGQPGIISIFFVWLNLFNHVLALFRVKFACISAIRYPVFMWESCKGFVWESVKNLSVWAFKRILTTGSCELLATGDSSKCHMCEACRKLKGHDCWSTTRQKVQSGLAVISWLKLATQPSHESKLPECPVLQKKCLHIPHVPYYKCRELWERILRKKS